MRSADLIRGELDEVRKKQQALNKAISGVNRKKRKANERAGQIIYDVPAEIRDRVMDLVDACAADRKKLEACERVLNGRGLGWDKVDTASDQEAAE